MSSPIRLFVGNLPDKVNENELRTAFSSFGEITALDIKNKPSGDNDKKLFAFITLCASNYDIESCIQHFTNGDFNGTRLYVTRARESFLERLQREREQAQKKEIEKNENLHVKVTPKPLNVNLHSNKRKFDKNIELKENGLEKKSKKKYDKEQHKSIPEPVIEDSIQKSKESFSGYGSINGEKDDKKQNSDKKRLESMRKKRQEFNEKKMIVKTGLTHIDKAPNKRIIFSDGDDNNEGRVQNGLPINNNESNKIADNMKKRKLFDEGDDSDNEVNFEVKKQFEGKQGQKVLDLQSRYKADKRFVLDERFVEDNKSDEEPAKEDNDESVELGQEDEKYKQLNILQDLLGVPIKLKPTLEPNKQTKSKIGMFRFDPTQPEHAKFLAPVEKKQEQSKKIKKKKSEEGTQIQQETQEIEKIEVSKEQFYKVTDTLKETLEQPSSFSLRSLFAKEAEPEENGEMPDETHEKTVSLSTKAKKAKNPFDPGEKNPFIYDSSDSENEEESKVAKEAPQICESKPIWRETLFFSDTDNRLSDGLSYFTQINNNNEKFHKDRRELRSVMKKRVYNKDRKNQMFQKKIGGRRKSNKKSFRKK